MTLNTNSDAAPAAVPPPGRYQLDPDRTQIHVNVKAMFGLFTVHGKMRLRSGEIVIAANPTGSSITAVIETDSYSSGNTKRDRDVTTAGLLDAGTYPEITFEADSLSPDGDGWVATGTVGAHGQSVNAELHVSAVALRDGVLTCRATTRLQRGDFGITKKKGMVGEPVDIAIDTVAVAN